MMNMKKIAGVVAAITLMFISAFSLSHDTCILFITNTASADYEFEFIDEDDSEDSYDILTAIFFFIFFFIIQFLFFFRT